MPKAHDVINYIANLKPDLTVDNLQALIKNWPEEINDLMEFEENGVDTLKEVHNVLLRFNSELKAWYRDYYIKIEVSKSEESFAMNLR
jgi:hypothetical protein